MTCNFENGSGSSCIRLCERMCNWKGLRNICIFDLLENGRRQDLCRCTRGPLGERTREIKLKLWKSRRRKESGKATPGSFHNGTGFAEFCWRFRDDRKNSEARCSISTSCLPDIQAASFPTGRDEALRDDEEKRDVRPPTVTRSIANPDAQDESDDTIVFIEGESDSRTLPPFTRWNWKRLTNSERRISPLGYAEWCWTNNAK